MVSPWRLLALVAALPVVARALVAAAVAVAGVVVAMTPTPLLPPLLQRRTRTAAARGLRPFLVVLQVQVVPPPWPLPLLQVAVVLPP